MAFKTIKPTKKDKNINSVGLEFEKLLWSYYELIN